MKFIPLFVATAVGVIVQIALFPLVSWGKFGIFAGTIALVGWPIDATINILMLFIMSFVWLFTGEKIVPYDTAEELKSKGWLIVEYM